MTKKRSRRLEKKLHLGEFKEWGFNFEAQIKETISDEAFVDALLAEVIEPRGLALAGWAKDGFICKAARGSATQEDRAAVLAWYTARPEVSSVKVGDLVDAWYGSLDTSEQ